LAGLIALALALAACSGQPGAQPSGELVVYTSRSEALFKPVIEAFNQASPNVTVTMLSGGNGDLAARLADVNLV
jgi:iron(III) transport system substrate-binding protein